MVCIDTCKLSLRVPRKAVMIVSGPGDVHLFMFSSTARALDGRNPGDFSPAGILRSVTSILERKRLM